MIGETVESAGLEEFRRLVENPPDIVISSTAAVRVGVYTAMTERRLIFP